MSERMQDSEKFGRDSMIIMFLSEVETATTGEIAHRVPGRF